MLTYILCAIVFVETILLVWFLINRPSFVGNIVVTNTPTVTKYSLELSCEPEDLSTLGDVMFNVDVREEKLALVE